MPKEGCFHLKVITKFVLERKVWAIDLQIHITMIDLLILKVENVEPSGNHWLMAAMAD